MGEKDMSEKILEDYNDVFSDIVNVLLFHGQELIEPSALESISVHSQYKGEDAKLHEQERDVAKKWKRYNVQLQLLQLLPLYCILVKSTGARREISSH